MKETEIKIVNTIKIQSIENGKKVTRRRFNMKIELPIPLAQLLYSYISDIQKEIYAERMGTKDWVSLIKKHTRSKQLRGWAASIIWWGYGKNADSSLYKLANSYNAENCKFKSEQLMMLLERMGCPKSINDHAAIREKQRNIAIYNYVKIQQVKKQ